jgi:diketogulonate reductase-like aldo/keto reductase
MTQLPDPTRRHFLKLAALAPLSLHLPAAWAQPPILRALPASGERLPAIGMGTWITFDVEPSWRDGGMLTTRWQVLREFFAGGGRLIDSSPMYGRAEAVLGELLPQTPGAEALYSATKVWTPGQGMGERQMARSLQLWGLPRFDLMQVHNLLDWQAHLPTLKRMKAEGAVRHIGITTSHGRRHDELAGILQRERLDCVQFTYNLAHREAEARLLPLAADRGCAVIINRPFDGGGLFSRLRGKALPGWAAEIGCENWAQVFLKFVISHPAVTCAIPATSDLRRRMVEELGFAA